MAIVDWKQGLSCDKELFLDMRKIQREQKVLARVSRRGLHRALGSTLFASSLNTYTEHHSVIYLIESLQKCDLNENMSLSRDKAGVLVLLMPFQAGLTRYSITGNLVYRLRRADSQT